MFDAHTQEDFGVFLRDGSKRVPGYYKGVRVVVPRKWIQMKEAVRRSVWNRYPVYFGAAKRRMYRDSAVKKLLGYDPSSRSDMTVDQNIRYTVAGLARVRNVVPIRNQITFVGVIHAWGINFETPKTYDYRKFVDSATGKLRRQAYLHELQELIELIYRSIPRNPKMTLLRIPRLGMGAYLSALGEEDSRFAQATFDKVLAACARRFRIQTDLCEYERTKSEVRNKYLTLPKGGNLFGPILPRLLATGKAYCTLVNAWDSRSFIGNGGSRDPTVDGQMVAATGAGSALPNTSYLHNPFFVWKTKG